MKADLISNKVMSTLITKKKSIVFDNVFFNFIIILFFILVCLFLIFRYIDKQKRNKTEIEK
jgi:preprotein translocase subunit YajC